MTAASIGTPNLTLIPWAQENGSVVVNATMHEPGAVSAVEIVFKVVVIGCMLAIMFAMGCEATLPELRMHLKRPVGLVIGMVSQFLFLPLVGFCTIKMLSVEGIYATSILILSCSPGGGYSNLLTYLSEGDVTLSVTMTTVSNVLALGSTPLNIYLYSKAINAGTITIPYDKMVISLLVLTLILALGMVLRWKWPHIAKKVTKIGVAGSGLMAIACGVLALFLYPDSLSVVPWQLFVAVCIMAPVGLSVAYFSAWLFRLGPKIQRTVAIESAVQSIGTAMTIVVVSFQGGDQKQASLYSILYGCVTVVGLLFAIAVFRIYKCFCVPKEEQAADKANTSLTEKETSS